MRALRAAISSSKREFAMQPLREMTKIEQMSDAFCDYYYCPACLWPGVLVDKGDVGAAKQEFDRHKCSDRPTPQK
jgi:hypothetical protein